MEFFCNTWCLRKNNNALHGYASTTNEKLKNASIDEHLLAYFLLLQSENIMLIEKQKVEKEQNTQLRNQVAHLLQLEQEQKMQIHERDVAIQKLQVKS